MTMMRAFTIPTPGLLGFALAALVLLAALPARSQGLQALIDAASPGDTVLVAPGDYTRAINVDKAITLLAQGPGDSRLARLNGSRARVVGLVFDASLAAVPSALVSAGDSLTLDGCNFDGGVRGVELTAGAAEVTLSGCSMNGTLEGIAFPSGLTSLRVEECTLDVAVAAVAGPDTLICEPPGPRVPADRCDGTPCGEITLSGVAVTGGDRQVIVSGPYHLVMDGCTLTGATTAGIRAAGGRIEISGTDFMGTGAGTALSLDSVSGFVHSCRLLSFDRGAAVGDGGCDRYSDLTVGGALDGANDIGGGPVIFQLAQPESVNAEFNFWGSTDCAQILPRISGQTVHAVTDDLHQGVYLCVPMPVQPLTWGRLKERYRPEGAGNR